MIDENKVQESVEVFTENDYWREYYETAPSEKCKRYIALVFYWSNDTSASGYEEERDTLLREMTLEDWEHLYKYADNNLWRTQCKNRIAELKK